jgi:hypothetical protein
MTRVRAGPITSGDVVEVAVENPQEQQILAIPGRLERVPTRVDLPLDRGSETTRES